LLGDEQSGQIRDVGYELYQSMLDDALDKMRAGKLEGLSDIDDTWAPQINLGVPVLIPESYVSDLDTRLGLYRRLSSLTSKVELEGFAAELIDRFGELPKEVNTLLLVVRIKAMCKRAYISKLDGGPKGATIQFYNDKFKSPSGLVKFINDENGLAKIRNNKLVVIRDWLKDRDRIKGSFSLAKDLAKLALEKN
jgi:transcription-repair coupling factor (superfamily II helicase)